ncbi:flagellar biosynthesis regulator FlaF [Paracoccus sp. 1_MG-2023]|uniref:flagellar biosynthesis regulator FlaF n=1 Tax=unclassified Paracoccus (in: a-proteobacteria) TaxID=2688777 RepID=UPI001C09D879|nr:MULTISPECIES: flagellar biosynthesis regulator FlaF [unclassified Paracoccus (in: a-proteobacteria)]MBU2956185.1 flagellar biosynthesis regulator FlaF [Paracoccus sp. C2R09]MDO6667862.1 flagellar biosynthesis regulator FlaF [Paracoccus sp. 1_MG-2023]
MRSTRDAEYDVFARVTRMLRQASDRRDRRDIIAAVAKNTELWTLLAFDLAEPGNGLPDDAKAGLISLAGFQIRHGQSVMAGEAVTQPLIDINMTVMRGLRGEVGA